jgi:hypothetical protein
LPILDEQSPWRRGVKQWIFTRWQNPWFTKMETKTDVESFYHLNGVDLASPSAIQIYAHGPS